MIKLSKAKFTKQRHAYSFQLKGDSFEQRYFNITQQDFPNLEEFWRIFVVPSTNRIQKQGHPIRQPSCISPETAKICNHNYVIFLRLIKCSSLISSPDYFSIDDFYAFLVSILDNFESLISELVILFSKYEKSLEPKFLTKLSKKDFLAEMSDFYDNAYDKLFDHYKKRGSIPLNLKHHTEKSILQQFFGKKELKDFFAFSEKVRQTRNIFLHSVRTGLIISPSKNHILIPKHTKISKYKDDYRKVFQAPKDPKIIKSDFIEAKIQMTEDLENVMKILNKLYEPLINKIKEIENKYPDYYKDVYNIEIV